MLPRAFPASLALVLISGAVAADGAAILERQFDATVRPFVDRYCVECHGREKPEAELDLSPYTSVAAVVGGFSYWELVQERLEAAEMPPDKAKRHPGDAERGEILAWIRALRRHEAERNAGDPGPVLARRLSNAEYDYTILDLTGADLRPTKEFPVDPANLAGFDNSGESLAMSPALVGKYLGAARTVAAHLVLKPEGFEFAPHPVVADTDRDKWGVLRIVEFYQRQPTDLAAYFAAAWRHHHRAALGQPGRTLAESAAAAHVSARYLERLWPALTGPREEIGPFARLQAMWRDLPAPGGPEAETELALRTAAMRDYVITLRARLVPEVANLTAPGVHNGSQTMVMWKNRRMAANRRLYDHAALRVEGSAGPPERAAPVPAMPRPAASAPTSKSASPRPPPRPGTPSIVQKGGTFLSPAIVTTDSSATAAMAASRHRASDPELTVPADQAERARHEAALARFADLFPDAFYITERARVYLDAVKEQDNAGRLLSAGLHSMTGYFRDDGPLYDLVLDDDGRAELDRLWREFEFLSAVPQRMHTSFVWFERTDSSFMRDAEFDPFRPEDKSVTSPEKIGQLAALYLAKAERGGAGETAQEAIRDHFRIVAENIQRVETDRVAAEPSHLRALVAWAAQAYRRPLAPAEHDDLLGFYRAARAENGLDHEEAMRDCVARVLMSPHFLYRADGVAGSRAAGTEARVPLSGPALASRLSYFLWSSLPDAGLLSAAARGDLQRPEELAAHARRMLRDPRARRLATEFAGQWLDFRRFEEHNAVDRERFPSFDHRLRQAMFEEPVRFLHALIRDEGPVLDLLYGTYTFVNGPLARHYGMPAPSDDESWVRVDRADRFDRGGLLPMAVFLTANSPGLRTSPVKRGYWVVRRVLGERIPPPPPVVPDLPNDERSLGDLTLRDVLARHREDKSCASCHARFDSFGLVFEGFGPVGERRTRDLGGRPVETRADFPGGREAAGVAGLRDYLRSQREPDFLNHLCRQLLAYALGRSLLMSDDPLLAAMQQRLVADGHRFSSLVESIVTSPQFRLQRAGAVAKTASLP